MVQFEVQRSESSSSPPPPSQALTSSIRSSASESSGQGASGRSLSPSHFRSPHLRSNLTRTQVGRDPLFYYEVVKTLGVGSMGSVAKVRKRTNVVGGSARKEIQDAFRRQKEAKKCLDIPFFGWFFKFCIDGKLKQSERSLSTKSGSDRNNSKSTKGRKLEKRTSSILRPAGVWVSESASSDNNYEDDNDEDSEADGVENLPGPPLASNNQNDQANCYAMKSIHLSRVTDESFVSELKNEIGILKKLDHPHIVRAIETFEHQNQIFIVMELCEGGDLYSRDPYTEEEAARVVNSVLNAVAYMHSRNVAHRDLKFENILFVNDSRTSEVKLIDFGLSSVYVDNAQLTDGVGTIYTMAPEVLKGNYSSSADLWSIGVIAYMLLSSQMPFYGRKRYVLYTERKLSCFRESRVVVVRPVSAHGNQPTTQYGIEALVPQ
jgi:serine/threonine protein kinase